MSDMTELIRLAKKGREAEKRSDAVWQFVGRLIVMAGFVLLRGLALMLLLGILHGHWPSVPSLAYWPSVAVVWLFRAVITPQQNLPAAKNGGSS